MPSLYCKSCSANCYEDFLEHLIMNSLKIGDPIYPDLIEISNIKPSILAFIVNKMGENNTFLQNQLKIFKGYIL